MSDFDLGPSFSTFEKRDKVLVALSGGVDSSVCVKILRDQGFEVRGLVIRFSPAHDAAVEAAKIAARELEIELHVADCEQVFDSEIIDPFCREYCRGVTPSPCVKCNQLVKFTTLANAATALGIHYIASGHYARVIQDKELFYIGTAFSEKRDQSYMLYRLPQTILQRLILPVGEFDKDDIREMALEAKLSSAAAPDSQEICFIPDGDYASYIKARGYTSLQGRFVGPHGEDLGVHKGVEHYTVGQRRGLDIAFDEALYVKAINSDGNIVLATANDEGAKGAVLTDLAFSSMPKSGDSLRVKIRSRAKAVPCLIEYADESRIEVLFDEPIRALAPGQSAVFYKGELVLGGGVISSALSQ